MNRLPVEQQWSDEALNTLSHRFIALTLLVPSSADK
jgi:hypothetical protein